MTKDWRELVDPYVDGTISNEDFARLQDALRNSAEARRTLRDLVTIDEKLERMAAERADRTDSSSRKATSAGSGRPRSGWAILRPLAAAALGLVIGAVSTSAVWGYAVSRGMSTGRVVSWWTEGYEGERLRFVEGFPREAERWGGGPARVVTSENDVQPVDGVRMLRLGPATDGLWSRADRLLDLVGRPLPDGVRKLELVASFRAAKPARKSRYILRAAVFDEEPEEIDPHWMAKGWAELDDLALARAARAFPVPPGTSGWQTAKLTVDVPDGARTLVISLRAATMDKPANYGAHYLDGVRLNVVHEESSP